MTEPDDPDAVIRSAREYLVLKRRRKYSLLGFIGYGIFMAIGVAIIKPWSKAGSDFVMLLGIAAGVICWFVGVGAQLRLQFFRCPRCGKRSLNYRDGWPEATCKCRLPVPKL